MKILSKYLKQIKLYFYVFIAQLFFVSAVSSMFLQFLVEFLLRSIVCSYFVKRSFRFMYNVTDVWCGVVNNTKTGFALCFPPSGHPTRHTRGGPKRDPNSDHAGHRLLDREEPPEFHPHANRGHAAEMPTTHLEHICVTPLWLTPNKCWPAWCFCFFDF